MKNNLLLAAVLTLVGVNGLSAMKQRFREENWKRVQYRGPITPGGPCLGKECRCRAHDQNADAQVQQPAAQQKNAQQLAAQKLAVQQLAAQQLAEYRKERQQKNRQRRKKRQQKNKQN